MQDAAVIHHVPDHPGAAGRVKELGLFEEPAADLGLGERADHEAVLVLLDATSRRKQPLSSLTVDASPMLEASLVVVLVGFSLADRPAALVPILILSGITFGAFWAPAMALLSDAAERIGLAHYKVKPGERLEFAVTAR